MKILKLSYMPRWGVLLLDLLLCTIAYWLSVWIGSGFFHYLDLSEQSTGIQYLIVLGTQLLAFLAFQTFSGILRYSTFIDTIKVFFNRQYRIIKQFVRFLFFFKL